MILRRIPSQEILCSESLSAQNTKERLIGLIGTKNLEGKAFYIPRCNWIHTFFMSIPIDVIYLDKKMKICKIDHNLVPWRFAAPVFKARSLVETPAGFARQHNLQIGEELYVGH